MTAALFYLSAAVLEAYYTILRSADLTLSWLWTIYQENIAAVVSVWQVEDCGVAPRANLD